ncbi:MAG: zinc ribbon domain-containing protein [Candidatus Lokiarchaeota archaeon]|nr:zinc ribbon domain-containing protein [Candidatus Lokiarchaeota archaeon]
MNFSGTSTKKRRPLGIWLLIFILITALSFILSLLINPIWWVMLPISLILLVVLKMMSHYFWLEKKTCPRCNAPTTKYSDFCRNCGYKLWFKCISCGKYIQSRTQFCEKCNIELDHTMEEKEIFNHEVLKEGSPLPKMNNYCPNCGSKLNNKENIKFCEECGEKL